MFQVIYTLLDINIFVLLNEFIICGQLNEMNLHFSYLIEEIFFFTKSNCDHFMKILF